PTLACQPGCSCACGPRVLQGKWYSVCSYLQLFYEDCTGASLDGDGSSAHGAWTPLTGKGAEGAGRSGYLQPHSARRAADGGDAPESRRHVQDLACNQRARVFFPVQKSVTLQPTPDFQACSPWARHRWLWAQHSNGRGAGWELEGTDTSIHQTSPLPAREGCGDREGSSSGFRGKSAVQTWGPTP
ncbi:NRSN2 protein, partial [Psophia crepitans]|nr:NRSN2 protein [Psophia crepitans]